MGKGEAGGARVGARGWDDSLRVLMTSRAASLRLPAGTGGTALPRRAALPSSTTRGFARSPAAPCRPSCSSGAAPRGNGTPTPGTVPPRVPPTPR